MNARIRAVFFTALVTACFVAAPALVHELTKERVERNQAARLQRAVLEAAGIAVPPLYSDVLALYDSRVEAESRSIEAGAVYTIKPELGAAEGGGYVIAQTGPGLWGRIIALVGFEADRKTLTGLSFLEQSETPGLGARIDEEWFKAQFRGKRGPFTTVPEGESSQADQFDAISGATLTSNAVRDILNAAAEKAAGIRK
jgi:Na+-transporting NADH:ubiquinone oxidoreductase subunit C